MKRTTYIIIGLFVLGLLLIPILLRTPAAEKNSSSFIKWKGKAVLENRNGRDSSCEDS